MLLSKFKHLQAVLPLNQIKFLSELDKDGEMEYAEILEQLDSNVQKTPSKSTGGYDAIVYLKYFLLGSTWYVTEYNRNDKLFFGYVILNNDYQNSEFGYFSFKELDEFNRYPLLMNMDFHFSPKPLGEILLNEGIIDKSDYEPKTLNSKKILIGDAYFKQNPSKILGVETLKKRGDRGENEFETIVKGSIENIKNIDVPIVKPFENKEVENSYNYQDIVIKTNENKNTNSIESTKQKAIALAQAISYALELELEFG